MIVARRFDWRTANPHEVTALLDEFVKHPEFLVYPMDREETRLVGADLLSSPANLVWTTYNDQRLTGCVLLTRLLPRVDALLHFFFIDNDLASKRNLLRNIIGYSFTDLGFNRVSMEVPEGVRLERFARKALGFRLEGEIRDRNPELPKCLDDTWVARQGSRREAAHFDGKEWRDIILLRVLAREWGEGKECQSEPLQEPQPLSSDPPSAGSLEVGDLKTPNPSSLETSSP